MNYEQLRNALDKIAEHLLEHNSQLAYQSIQTVIELVKREEAIGHGKGLPALHREPWFNGGLTGQGKRR